MSESTSNITTAPPATASGQSWSIGVFACGGSQLPSPCLRHCLNGSPTLASSLGCPMVRRLAQHVQSESTAAAPIHVDAPAVCNKGYAVTLTTGDAFGNPHILLLRPQNQTMEDEAPLAPAVEALQSAAAENWRLAQENHGLANEVLRSYEQINLIFDVSAQIAILNDATEVRRMLLLKICHLFDADMVFYVSSDCRMVQEVSRNHEMRRGWVKNTDEMYPSVFQVADSGNGDTIKLPPEFSSIMQRLQQSRRVLVSSSDASYAQTGHGTSLWGPLMDDGEDFGVVGIIRRSAPFIAGDMLVLDSALTYGGHILSNLKLVEQLKRTSFEAVRALVNAIDQKDNYTYGHSERVGFLAKVTGQALGMPTKQLQELEWAGLLHDVGKIGIPEHVLNKPGRLTEEEFALIKEHPGRSYEVLKPVASLEPVLDAVLHHHENPDGTGYPKGLKGEDIPLMARIIHVVDVFDALTSTRSYRGAYDTERAIDIMKKDAGTKLDAQIVECFLGAWSMLANSHPEQYRKWFGSGREATV
jgi:HD-GYP domain-containing protein (c-di-GMP phosphodiesterase class II)